MLASYCLSDVTCFCTTFLLRLSFFFLNFADAIPRFLWKKSARKRQLNGEQNNECNLEFEKKKLSLKVIYICMEVMMLFPLKKILS